MLRPTRIVLVYIVALLAPAVVLASPDLGIGANVPPSLQAIYQTHQFEPLWLENGKPSAQLDAALTAMEHAAEDGLNPSDYGTAALRDQQQTLSASTPDNTQLMRFDFAVTNAFLQFASDLSTGRINPAQLGFTMDTSSQRSNVPDMLGLLLQTQSIDSIITTLRPPVAQYQRLKTLLQQTRLFAAQYPDTPALPAFPEKKLEPGQTWDGCPALANWLVILGDMPANNWPEQKTLYEGSLVEAIKHFQTRHGLESDGVIGGQTAQMLRVPLTDRVIQIELAMERLRWLDRSISESRYLLVNIPQFTLFGFEPDSSGGKAALEIRVVVGKAGKNETPLLAKSMSHVIFSPYWNVPRSIAMKEILPKWRQDFNYIASQNMELVDSDGHVHSGQMGEQEQRDLVLGDFRLRQRPGKQNALGGIKFMFPNDDSIYMHDTPQQRLFLKDRRDFSHGCIRLADPMALAMFVLKPQGDWDEKRVQEKIDTGIESHLRLQQPLPVIVTYLTASVGPDGEALFFRDVYGQDAELQKQLASHRNRL